MTATASAPSAQTAPSNGNQAARQPSGSAAASKTSQRSPADLFANLMGLIGTTGDDPQLPGAASLGGESLANGAEPEDPDALWLTDPALGVASANPLADLIGWPGAASAASTALKPSASATADSLMAPANALASALPDGASDQAGRPLQGMTVLAQPAAADPGLVSDLKNPAAASNATPTPGNLPSTAQAATSAATDRDAVSVRYGDAAETQTETEATPSSRNNAYMAARPANWRSTTALATSAASTASHNLPTSAPTQTAAIQVAQNAATQRSALVDPSRPAPRNTVALTERFSDTATSAADAAGAELGALGAPSQTSQGHTGSSGSGREDPMLTGLTTPEATDADAPEEAFSLDAALASEEELEGAEFMSPQQLRHASVRVGEGTDEAIDIRLSMEGDAVNVEFRTDNAEVRAGLQHNAGASLSDLMQRGGVQLGGVSVGAQSQQPRGQSGDQASAQGQVGASSGRSRPNQAPGGASSSDAPHKPPAARRSDGGPALDVFA